MAYGIHFPKLKYFFGVFLINQFRTQFRRYQRKNIRIFSHNFYTIPWTNCNKVVQTFARPWRNYKVIKYGANCTQTASTKASFSKSLVEIWVRRSIYVGIYIYIFLYIFLCFIFI